MTHLAYIIAGYGLTTGILGGYALWMRMRHRALLAFDERGRGDGDGAEQGLA